MNRTPFSNVNNKEAKSYTVSAYLQHADLSESDLLDHFVILTLEELLDGHELTGVLVAALEHHAIAALPHQPLVLILLHALHSTQPTPATVG